MEKKWALNQVITGLVRKVQGACAMGVSMHTTDWLTFENDLAVPLRVMERDDNLQVHDPRRGGVLRGSPSGRKKLEVGTGGPESCIKANVRWFKEQNLGRREVVYARAVFNSPGHTLKANMDAGNDEVRLIAYEAPLLRKRTKRKSMEISDRSVSCDLVGMCGKRLVCIEMKMEPDTSGTSLPYALLEAHAYGYYLSHHRDHPDLPKEMALCLRDFRGLPLDVQCAGRYSVEYVVGGSVSYFAAYNERTAGRCPKTSGKGPKAQMTPEKIHRRLSEARAIEALFKGAVNPMFGGYWVFDRPSAKVPSGNAPLVVPEFSPPLGPVAVYNTIDALLVDIGSR